MEGVLGEAWDSMARRFEIPDPKHANWLNMAEIGISVFARGCLFRPVATTQARAHRMAALEAECSANHATIQWQFLALDSMYQAAETLS